MLNIGTENLVRRRQNAGQAAVEAAFLIPALLLAMLLLIQPAILLYDRMVMEGAAAEGCRVLVTESFYEQGTSAADEFIRRRLAAIPQQENFHVHQGECSWQIECHGSESESVVQVKITGEIKPLPLFDFGLAALGVLNGRGNFELTAEQQLQTKSSWVQSSSAGTDPQTWIDRWNAS